MLSLLSFVIVTVASGNSSDITVQVQKGACKDCGTFYNEFPLSTYLYAIFLSLVFALIFFFIVDLIVISIKYLIIHYKDSKMTYGFVFKHSLSIHIIVGILSLLFGVFVYRLLFWLI